MVNTWLTISPNGCARFEYGGEGGNRAPRVVLFDMKILAALILLVAPTHSATADDPKPFAIEVVDADTGRGVPLVELRTVHHLLFITDSNGLVAFNEPGLMDRDVHFTVFSHGYDIPVDGFGIRGKAFKITPGGGATLKLKRRNNAERLYRVTGEGIYRDSILLGRKTPIEQPLLNGRVLGQDSVFTTIYRGKLYWFWGDTNRESYPLGQFHMSGATSKLPQEADCLNPDKGVNLTYFVDKDGFSRGMAPRPEPGPVWLDAIMVVKDDAGKERMVAHYGRMKSLSERVEHGLMVYNDEREIFEKTAELPKDAAIYPQGQASVITIDGHAYYYFAHPYATLRVKADFKSVSDMSQYEAFTCLKPGQRYDKYNPPVDRDAAGKLNWSWKRDAEPVTETRQKEMIDGKHIKPEEAWLDLRDAESKKQITLHAGSVHFNAYRKKYIMIANQIYGTSMLGEVWFTESDAPHGPFRKARKVVTHEKYSFYNPRHHAFFDQEGGRLIYFEGTYNELISGAKMPTPRYDYNQVMYRLDLGDTRLKLE